jgi:hypothetical protein
VEHDVGAPLPTNHVGTDLLVLNREIPPLIDSPRAYIATFASLKFAPVISSSMLRVPNEETPIIVTSVIVGFVVLAVQYPVGLLGLQM